jgi:hypothetical protein
MTNAQLLEEMPRFEHDSGLYAYEMIEMPSHELATYMKDYYSFEAKVFEIARSKKSSKSRSSSENKSEDGEMMPPRVQVPQMLGAWRGGRGGRSGERGDERGFRGGRGGRGGYHGPSIDEDTVFMGP